MTRSGLTIAVLALALRVGLGWAQPPAVPQTAVPSTPQPTTAPAGGEEVTFRNQDVALAGLLSLPSGAGPHPAVVLVSGSGPQDRDGATRVIPGYQPFVLLAELCNREGFAVLRYDDRGVGKSGGDYLDGTEQDFVADTAAAITYLRGRKEIQPDKIGILGQSEGGMIAAMVAAEDSRVAFVISMAGPAVRGYDLLLRQVERSSLAEGMSQDEVAQVVKEEQRIFDLVLAKQWDELKVVVHDTTLRRLQALPPLKKALVGDPEEFAKKRTAQSMSAFQSQRYQFILDHDASDDWARLSIPVLGLFGELDVQCDAAQNKPALEAALARNSNTNVTTVVIPAANHLFLQARSGGMSEYLALSKREFAPGTAKAISEWLREKAIRR